MTSNNQRRLLLLLKLLYEQTDETHFVSGADILRYRVPFPFSDSIQILK